MPCPSPPCLRQGSRCSGAPIPRPMCHPPCCPGPMRKSVDRLGQEGDVARPKLRTNICHTSEALVLPGLDEKQMVGSAVPPAVGGCGAPGKRHATPHQGKLARHPKEDCLLVAAVDHAGTTLVHKLVSAQTSVPAAEVLSELCGEPGCPQWLNPGHLPVNGAPHSAAACRHGCTCSHGCKRLKQARLPKGGAALVGRRRLAAESR